MNNTLILFTKEPKIGLVKTRLIPALGKQGAYSLYCQFIQLMLKRFAKTDFADFIIYTTPPLANKNSYFKDFPQLKIQVGQNLGDKMYHSLAQELHSSKSKHIRNKKKVLLFGADCPFLSIAIIQQVIESLEKNDIVFIPAKDGGYVLIGATKICPEVFKNINWSTSQVMRQTKKNIEKLGYQYHLFEPLSDIDEAEDLLLLKI